MARLHTSALLLAAGLTLVGCATSAPDPSNRSLESVNQPVVQRTDYVIDLNAGGGSIPPSELDRLNSWFQALQLGYGDRVAVDEPYGYDAGTRAQVAEVADRYGLLLSTDTPITAGRPQPGTTRVIVSRAAASVPGCPNWHEIGDGTLNATSPNFGCAVNSNLAAMIANPSDLVLGQTGNSTGDAATAAKAIKVYRDAEPTGKGGLAATSSKGN